MGFLDKTKATFSSTSSKVNESSEVRKLESQIKDERAKVKDNYELIGKEYYRYTVDNDEAHMEEIRKLVDRVNDSRKLIEEYEQEIENVRQKGKEDRESMRAEVEAKQKEVEDEKEAKRQEKKREEKENDDLF